MSSISEIFSYSADDAALVREVKNLHCQIDVGSLRLESVSRNLDSDELSLLMPYLDSINVLISRAIRFTQEIKK